MEMRVFPTCVGVILVVRSEQQKPTCIPHMRGGDPSNQEPLLVVLLYSPQSGRRIEVKITAQCRAVRLMKEKRLSCERKARKQKRLECIQHLALIVDLIVNVLTIIQLLVSLTR